MKKIYFLLTGFLLNILQGYSQLQFNPTFVHFGSVTVTTTSSVQVIFTSLINQTITLSGLSGPFSCSPTTFPISIGEQKIITISFNPQEVGYYSQTLTATGSIWGTATCEIYGEGIPPTINFYPDWGVYFGSVLIYSQQQLTITIQSDITQVVTLSELEPPFSVEPAQVQLQANQPAFITITFNPQQLGYYSQTLYATGSYWGSASCEIYGECVPASFSFDPWWVDFGSVMMLSQQQQIVSIQSNLTQEVFFSGLQPPFSVEPSQIQLQANVPANITITFYPSVPGQYQQYLYVTGAVSGSGSLNLQGSAYGASVYAFPTSITFPSLYSNQSQSQTIIITTDLPQGVTLSGLSGVFSVSPAYLELQPGVPGSAVVTFAPSSPGNFTQNLLIQGSIWGSAQVAVSGSCIDPKISVTPTSLDFGEVIIGNTSSRTLTISNTGNGNLTCNFTISNNRFSLSHTSLTVPQGSNNTLTVYFTPLYTVPEMDTLRIQSNDPGNPLIKIPMTGKGKSLISGNFCGTLYKINSPYYLTGNLTIPEDCEMTIEPGVEIYLEGKTLTVNGKMTCRGLPGDSIVFNGSGTIHTSSKYPGDTLSYVSFRNSSSSWLYLNTYGISFRNCNLRGASVYNSEPNFFTYSNFENNQWNDKWSIVNPGYGSVYVASGWYSNSTKILEIISSSPGMDFGVMSNPIPISQSGKVRIKFNYSVASSSYNSNTQWMWRVNNGNWNLLFETCYGCINYSSGWWYSYYYWNYQDFLIDYNFNSGDILQLLILNNVNNSSGYYQRVFIDDVQIKFQHSFLEFEQCILNVKDITNTTPDPPNRLATKFLNCIISLTENIENNGTGSFYMENCQITGSGNNTITFNGSSSILELKNVSITNFQGNAVSAYGSSNIIRLKGCNISGTYGSGTAVYSYGGLNEVFVTDCNFLNLQRGIMMEYYPRRLNISKSTISSCSSDGILLRDCSIVCDSVLIHTTGSTGLGIYNHNYSYLTGTFSISNSEIRNCNGYGIGFGSVNSSNPIEISNTVVINNQSTGISVSSGTLNISNSKIKNNNWEGIYVGGRCNIFGCEVYRNNYRGIYAGEVLAWNTVISANKEYGIQADFIEAFYVTSIYNQKHGLYCNNNTGKLYNSIVCLNRNILTNQLYGFPEIYYSRTSGNPQLADSLGHLKPVSPCIDAADPLDQDAHIPFGMKTIRADMGAYGGPDNWIWGGTPVPEDGSPQINRIVDIPNDQGKKVGIQFRGSIFDYGNTAYTINKYSFWRELDVNGKQLQEVYDEPIGPIFRRGPQYWEYIGEMPASGFQYYGYTAPTMGDSTAAGIFWSKFLVVAHSLQGPYWVSVPDSGYSVDNLAPRAPLNLAGMIAGNKLNLQWLPSPDEDVQYYAVYRSETDLFGNDPVAITQTTSLEGLAIDQTDYRYAVAAFDYGGNKGELSNIVISPVADLFTLPGGWSGVSIWFYPVNPQLNTLLSPISNELILLYNQSGIYWPGQNINTLNTWNRNAGYIIKMLSESSLPAIGYKEQSQAFITQPGWQILPVLTHCGTHVSELLNQLGPQLRMVKEVAGNRIYWPAYGIHTLQYLEPGKAYYLNTTEGFGIFNYPSCNQRATTSGYNPEQILPGLIHPEFEFIPTPTSHVVVFSETAATVFETGDIIGAFDETGICAGATVIDQSLQSFAVTVFGDDAFTDIQEGLLPGKHILFRVYRQSSGEMFDLEVTFDASLPDWQGVFTPHGLSLVSSVQFLPVAVHSLDIHSIRLFPNPTSSCLNITGIQSGTPYQIQHSNGLTVITGTLGPDGVIDLEHLTTGIYFITLQHKGKPVTLKFSVVR